MHGVPAPMSSDRERRGGTPRAAAGAAARKVPVNGGGGGADSAWKRRGSATAQPMSRAAASRDAARPPPPPAVGTTGAASRRRDRAYWWCRRKNADTERPRIELAPTRVCQMRPAAPLHRPLEVRRSGSAPPSNVRSLGSAPVDIVSLEVGPVATTPTGRSARRRPGTADLPSGLINVAAGRSSHVARRAQLPRRRAVPAARQSSTPGGTSPSRPHRVRSSSAILSATVGSTQTARASERCPRMDRAPAELPGRCPTSSLPPRARALRDVLDQAPVGQS